MRTLFVGLSVALLWASGARAEGLRDFCPDRPGKATPACILDAGHLQLEVGLIDAVFERHAGTRASNYAVGAAELRFGLSRRAEVQVAWSPLVVDHPAGEGRRTGTGDMVLGLRHALSDPDADGPAISVQGFVTVPTATHGLGAGGWTGGLRLPVGVPLRANLDLALTPEVGLVRDLAGQGVHATWGGVAGVSRAFGALTLGAELWGQVDDDPTGSVYYATGDLSAALALGENAQVDVGVNLGLNAATPGVEIYAGVARRF